MRASLVALAVLGLAVPAGAGAATLVQVKPAAAPVLRAGGAKRVSAQLGVWRTDSPSLVRRLRARGLLRLAEPERGLVSMDETVYTDPLASTEWWLTSIGVAGLVPPGPGRPITVVDSGVDVRHQEFAGRQNFSVLNEQTTFGRDEDHGTEVSSVVGAPQNGFGVVGIYPQAVLRVFDASPFRGITNSEAIAGLEAAASGGPGVINLSWGSPVRDPLIEQAIERAVRAGSLVVAAAGNERMTGSPTLFPAGLPHVLTIGATDRSNAIANFSSPAAAIDLVAPGVDIPVADPFASSGYFTESGTSFAAPLVAGAAAWIWTVRPELDASQVFELIRRTAQDLGPPGWDIDSGFGLLNVPAALAAPAPISDPQEPNDDVRLVAPNSAFGGASRLLAAPAQLSGRLDAADDPRDVFRIRLPANRRLRVAVQSTDGRPITVVLWSAKTRTVLNSTGRAVGRLVRGAGVASLNVGKRGSIGYLELAVGSTRRTDYTVTVSAAAP